MLSADLAAYGFPLRAGTVVVVVVCELRCVFVLFLPLWPEHCNPLYLLGLVPVRS